MKFRIKIQVMYLFIAFSVGIMLILFNPIIGEFVYIKGQVEYYRMFQFWGCWDTIGEGPTNGMDPNYLRLTMLLGSIFFSFVAGFFSHKPIIQGVFSALAFLFTLTITVVLIYEYFHILEEIAPHVTFATETPHIMWLILMLVPQALVAASQFTNFRIWLKNRS
jgi:hypothetical protein